MKLYIYAPNGGMSELIDIVDYQIGSVASRFVTNAGDEIRLPAATPWAVFENKEEVATRDERPSNQADKYGYQI